MNNFELVLSSQQNQVFQAMMRGENVALFGDAGSGKSLIIKKFLREKSDYGDVICLAPTGLAARNIGKAQTIHSFFSIDPGCVGDYRIPVTDRLLSILSLVRTVVIDEISMVRSDIFDMIERCLRRVNMAGDERPFGGLQIIVVGDFKQLSPVVNEELVWGYLDSVYGGEYAFMSRAWKAAGFKNFYLQHSFRQNSLDYVNILNSIRHNRNLLQALNLCNQKVVRHTPSFDEFQNSTIMALCSKRDLTTEINDRCLSFLQDEMHHFVAVTYGKFPETEYPTDSFLKLKIGTKVMVLANKKTSSKMFNNDYEYVNGDIGLIVDISEEEINVQLMNGRIVGVRPFTWYCYEYDLVEEEGEKKIAAKIVGSFCQLPLAVAYASTIHKAQGQTLDSIFLILGNGCFASGQLYTALSRIRNLRSLFLSAAIQPTDAISDPVVDDFYMSVKWE